MFAAFLDTCVLWPSLQRDFLLSLAIENLYRPIWSDAVLDELEYEEAAKRQRRGQGRGKALRAAEHLTTQMRQHFDDAIVTGWEPLEGTYGLPDSDDEHVLAAAVMGGAGAIVTHNLKDFPATVIPPGMQIVKPADFAADTVAVNPERALLAVGQIASRSVRRPRTIEELLSILTNRYDMGAAVLMMRSHL